MNIYSDILIYGGLVIVVVFSIIFTRNIKMLTADEVVQLKAGSSRRNIYITVVLFIAISYFDSFNIRLLIAISIVLHMILESWLQNQKLKREHFNHAYMKSMRRAELLSYVAVIMILAGLVISAKA